MRSTGVLLDNCMMEAQWEILREQGSRAEVRESAPGGANPSSRVFILGVKGDKASQTNE